MLEKFHHYFKEIEMAAAIQDRAEQICSEFAHLLPNPIDRVFVNDLYDQQGVRGYLNLELLGQGILMELKNFIVADNIDFLDLNSGVKWIEVVKTEIKNITDKPSTKSTINVNIVFSGSGVGMPGRYDLVLRAAHNNCSHLAEFVRAELPPEMRRGRPLRSPPALTPLTATGGIGRA